MSRGNSLRASLLALAALAGCASPQLDGTVDIQPVPVEPRPAEEPASVPSQSAGAAGAAAPANAPAAVAAEPPKPAPKPHRAKPWTFKYSAGQRLATFDGVSVHLGEPAVSNWKKKTVGPSALDAKYTVGPLVTARTNPAVSGRRMRVCIDPGHGGDDSGAVSADGKTAEKTIALDISRRLARRLRADGFEVMLTRGDDDTAVELSDRADAARAWRADAFVSIHLNSEKGSSARGLETYAFTAPGMESSSHRGGPSAESRMRFPGNANDAGNVQLAFSVHRRLVRAAAGKTEDRGMRRARWVVLREARSPAVLVECGFLSSAKDLAWLRSESGRETVARGIYEGICDFAFGTMAPGLPARKPPERHAAGAAAPGKQSAVAPEIARGSPLERIVPPRFEQPLNASPDVSAARAAALAAAGLADSSPGNKDEQGKKTK